MMKKLANRNMLLLCVLFVIGSLLVWRSTFFCPIELEDKCAYELMMNFERGYYYRNNKRCTDNKLPMDEDHPGFHAVFFKKSKHYTIPIISASDGFHDIADFKVGQEYVSVSTTEIRETYARRALLLFEPLRVNEHIFHRNGTFGPDLKRPETVVSSKPML